MQEAEKLRNIVKGLLTRRCHRSNCRLHLHQVRRPGYLPIHRQVCQPTRGVHGHGRKQHIGITVMSRFLSRVLRMSTHPRQIVSLHKLDPLQLLRKSSPASVQNVQALPLLMLTALMDKMPKGVRQSHKAERHSLEGILREALDHRSQDHLGLVDTKRRVVHRRGGPSYGARRTPRPKRGRELGRRKRGRR